MSTALIFGLIIFLGLSSALLSVAFFSFINMPFSGASRALIFEKMGLSWWKGIFPYYSTYKLFEKIWTKKAFWTLIIGTILFFVSYITLAIFFVLGLCGEKSKKTFLSANSYLPIESLIPLVLLLFVWLSFSIFSFIIVFKFNSRLAEAFGKSKKFVFGLVFLAPIYNLILGLDGSKYKNGSKLPANQDDVFQMFFLYFNR